MRYTPTSEEVSMILFPHPIVATPFRMRLWRMHFKGYMAYCRQWKRHANGIHYLVDMFDGKVGFFR